MHELITTLMARRYLGPAESGRYLLVVRTHQLGSRYADQFDLISEGEQAARQTSARYSRMDWHLVSEATAEGYPSFNR